MSETLREKVIEALRKVYDPEIPVNVHDLGLIYAIEGLETGAARVKMTLTTPNCPEAERIPGRVREAVESVDGIESAEVELVWEPRWTPESMSEAARLTLGMY